MADQALGALGLWTGLCARPQTGQGRWITGAPIRALSLTITVAQPAHATSCSGVSNTDQSNPALKVALTATATDTEVSDCLRLRRITPPEKRTRRQQGCPIICANGSRHCRPSS